MKSNNFSAYIKTPYFYSDYIISKYAVLLIPVPIIKIAIGEGLKVFEIAFEDKYKNFAGYIKPNKKAIYINETMNLENKRFAIAQQLGHYLMHKYQVFNPAKRTDTINIQDNHMTIEANIFATNLLIPTTTLKLKVPQYKSIKYPQKVMAKEFQVSENIIHFKLSMLNDIHKLEKENKTQKKLKVKQIDQTRSKELLLQNVDKLKDSIAIDLEKREIIRKESIKKIFEELE
ncbi:ImmA/IrrE family metallo-endopeptidase (plasmid) [Borrelia miyamotoi]|uniref:ImmA/IrrE family metallo-endopeptidase n=1 Tax=Borrelia miyamotoi TaxID=47466 RepID=A0AAX3JP99_9SPIR|nr:ImmA/IrrE family metallo-endopeptidase [Borrelia miyamotoi]QFP42404.1 ImmA/IrrE family metallo-endopeptidase [Borrelia miyamotoi]QFP48524.1 ImmA/IrrE family metallo-endopeptidase [Borrelia miyamotoi]WAZ72617.1 ImmA/IrrE family metallo-endopeptidase [Borrelia miyamotoi]